MVNLQDVRLAKMLAPISVAGGATATCTEVDTAPSGIKYNYAKVVVQSGLVGANGVATIKVQESDTSGSGGADFTGGSFTALVDADDGIILSLDLDLRKRKRYLTLVLTNGATNASVMSCVCILGRANEMPTSATAKGVQESLIV